MKTKTITHLGLLLAIALALQCLHLPTFMTGPGINAVLIIAVVYPGVLSSVMIGCITPLAALALGILNPVAAPLIPVIMTANAVLGFTFSLLRQKNDYIALAAAAVAKYAVFFVSLNYLLGILNVRISAPMLAAFQLPQLFTALVGGAVGVGIIKYLDKIYYTQEEDKASEENLFSE